MSVFSGIFSRAMRIVSSALALPGLAVVGLVASAAPALAAQSAMCADINATFANISITQNQTGPSRNYPRSQYALGDVITITVTAVASTGGGNTASVSGAGYPGVEEDAITPSNVSIQAVGSVSATVTDVTTGPNIQITSMVGSASHPTDPFTFSITCTSAAVMPPTPTPDAAAIDPIDPIVNVVQQTHTALVARTVSVPSLPQRVGGTAGPGTFSTNPSENGVVLNYATSLVQLQNWGAAGDAADVLANSDPLDQPFNFWIDGTGAIHARTSSGVDYWGTFGLFSAGADYLVSREVLVGLAVHGDGMRDLSSTSEINSRGVMAGPYISAEVTEGVFLDIATYYGKSWADVKSGNFLGSYDTQRLVATGSLKGQIDLSDQLVLSPNATIFYLREIAAAYSLSDGATTQAGAAFDATQYRVSVGSHLAYKIDLEGGQVLTPFVGANLGLIFDGGSTNLFGNATTGFAYDTGSGASLGANLDANLDGTSFRSLGARATARLAF
jgi:outer membrane autotransporter protein